MGVNILCIPLNAAKERNIIELRLSVRPKGV